MLNWFKRKPKSILLYSGAFEKSDMMNTLRVLFEWVDSMKEDPCAVYVTLDVASSKLLFFVQVGALVPPTGPVLIARMATRLEFIFKTQSGQK